MPSQIVIVVLALEYTVTLPVDDAWRTCASFDSKAVIGLTPGVPGDPGDPGVPGCPSRILASDIVSVALPIAAWTVTRSLAMLA